MLKVLFLIHDLGQGGAEKVLVHYLVDFPTIWTGQNLIFP